MKNRSLIGLFAVSVSAVAAFQPLQVTQKAPNHKNPSSEPELRVATLDESVFTGYNNVPGMVDDDMLAVGVLDIPHTTDTKLRKKPSWQAWKRRLNTKEDSKCIHKMTNAAFVLSSTGIIVGGVLTGFHDIPTWTEPLVNIFVAASFVQGYTAVSMVKNHRRKDPEKGASHIYISISTCLLAFIAAWVSPHCPEVLQHSAVASTIFCGLSVANGIMDYDYSRPNGRHDILNATRDFQQMRQEMNAPWQNAMVDFVTKYGGFIGTPANLLFCRLLLSEDRDTILDMMTSQGLAGDLSSGTSIEYVYYLSVISGTLIAYSSLVGTLRHKKLVPREVELYVSFASFAVSVSGTVAPFLGFHL